MNDAIEDCVFDACIESDSADEMICNALSAFVQECQGGDVSGWREEENCRKWKNSYLVHCNGSFTLLDPDTDTDSDSDSKPNGYIVLCRIFHIAWT